MFRLSAFIRTDGNSIIGYGHTMRMIALAEIISFDFDIYFLVKDTSEWIKSVLSLKYSILQLPDKMSADQEIEHIGNLSEKADLIILDGYSFNSEYQASIRQRTNLPVVAIDDFQPFSYKADLVINHAGLIDEKQFFKEDYTRLLLGPDYALLRKDFNEIARCQRKFLTKVESAFICLGGSDSDQYCQVIVKLFKLGIESFMVVVNDKEKYKNLRNISGQIELYSNLTAGEMIELMKHSDLAVLPASTLCYEYCCVSGGLFIIKTAENQEYIHNFIIGSGCGSDYNGIDLILGSSDILNIINKQIGQQFKYFKGQNENLLRKEIFGLTLEKRTILRYAEKSDMMLYFEWANEEETRRNSINRDKILLKNHKTWFFNKLVDPYYAMYLLCYNEIPVGNIRFEIKENQAVLSYSIANDYRRKGLGIIILKKGISKFLYDYPQVSSINGYVHRNNLASINSFIKVGFAINENCPANIDNFNYYSLNRENNENR